MKTYIDFLKEGNEGMPFRAVVDNLDEPDFEQAAEDYHQYKLKLLDIPDVVGQSEQLVCDDHDLKEVDRIGDKVFKMCDSCGETKAN